MAISSLGFQFTVDRVPVEVNTDVRLNVTKRRSEIRYRSSTVQDNVNLAYVISPEVVPEHNLFISNHSDSLIENQVQEDGNISLFAGRSTTIDTDRFLLTDIYTTASNSQAEVPLFFRHNTNEFDLVVSSGELTILSMDVVDQDMESVADENLLFVPFSGYVYNNLLNEFDPDTGEFSLYFVKYSLRDEDNGEVLTHLELLNNHPVFREATVDDLDDDGNLDPELPVYTTEDAGSSEFDVNISRIRNYAIKPDKSSKIKLFPPAEGTELSNPWYIEVSNGKFFASVSEGGGLFSIQKYEVAEFGGQLFTPFFPYKLQSNETSLRVNNHIIKTLKDKIVLDPVNDMHVRVIVRTSKDRAKYAYTTDTSLIGEIFEGSIEYSAGIRSLDGFGGFIDVTDPIASTDKIEATYYYQEDRFVINSLDLNPLTDVDVLQRRYPIYVVPNNTGSRDETIQYLAVDSDGLILDATQEDNQLLLDLMDSGLYYDRQTLDLDTVSGLSFINRFTTETDLDADESAIQSGLLRENPHWFVLGEAIVRGNSSPNQAVLLDVRIPGGGIKDTKLEEAVQREPEAQWYWDNSMWDGVPYPGLGSVYAEVPSELLSDYGGRFKADEIRQAVDRHLALGGYPVIRAYNFDPVISGYNIEENQITIYWPPVEDEEFNVRYSVDKDGIFAKANSAVLTNNANGNEFTVSGLASGSVYWFYITTVNEDNIEPVGGPIGPVSDNSTFQAKPNKLGIMTLPVLG